MIRVYLYFPIAYQLIYRSKINNHFILFNYAQRIPKMVFRLENEI